MSDERQPKGPMQGHPIARHRTALRRTELSLPMKCLQRDGLIGETTPLLDYGCGYGEDVHLLHRQGFQVSGWDPYFQNDAPPQASDIVNLGYVINVIEDPVERAETLRRAWSLSNRVLSVAAQIVVQGRGSTAIPFGDGIVTRIGTFQKFFSQDELREYIERELGTEAAPAAPGIFFVFRDEALRQQWLSQRYRRRNTAPKKCISEKRFEEHRDILEPLMETITALGRLPEIDEFSSVNAVCEQFGSLRRAFSLIRRMTGDDAWDAIAEERRQDLLIYLALGRFRKRPPISRLPMGLQRDIRAFFGSYTTACAHGDELLFRAGDAAAIDAACKESEIGKLLPTAMYIHQSALEQLSPLLRVYEGCARAFIGDVPDATVIKLHRFSGKVSYLVYPDFLDDPHPSLVRGVKVDMRSRDVYCYEYDPGGNPPILHRKETMLSPDHTHFKKFSRLTVQEERAGLLDESATIGTRQGWKIRLIDRGYEIKGHRLLKSKRKAPDLSDDVKS